MRIAGIGLAAFLVGLALAGGLAYFVGLFDPAKSGKISIEVDHFTFLAASAIGPAVPYIIVGLIVGGLALIPVGIVVAVVQSVLKRTRRISQG